MKKRKKKRRMRRAFFSSFFGLEQGKAAFSSAAFVFVGYVPPVPAYGDDWAMISLPST
ncbi:hypothetical protein [uncultured Megasphaera sp.]|uniref:hypothetical protein n=1 Tax=uncultured Megasphaera sp. TaxID=165188 RepID=UPI00259719C9|nr:hypothetical protein [uncultured Megasphaera sp.]